MIGYIVTCALTGIALAIITPKAEQRQGTQIIAVTTTSASGLLSASEGHIINCGFRITTNTEHSISAPSNTAPKSTVLNITWGAAKRKRRRRRRNNNVCPSMDDTVLRLTTISSYFNLTEMNNNFMTSIITKTCLYANYSEVLHFRVVHESDPGKIYAYDSLTIHIQPTIPNFLPPSHDGSRIEVNHCDLNTNLTVVSARNGGSCISWSCAVKQDLFWVENDINVMTSVNGIQDGLPYNLTMSCNELSTCKNIPGQTHTSVQRFEVVFYRKCSLHVSTSTVSPIQVTTKSAVANICPITDLTVGMTQSVSKLTPHAVRIQTSVKTWFSTDYKASAILATSPLTETTLETTNDKITFGKNAAVSLSATKQMKDYSVSPALSKLDRKVNNGFLDDPRKKAAVATTGSIIIAIALAVGSVIVSRKLKLCVCVPVIVSPEAEEEENEKVVD